MKIGMLGFGSMGKTHTWCLKNIPFFYSTHPEIELVGVCAAHYEKALAAKEAYGYRFAAKNEDEIIYSDEIDTVDVCTPNCFHYETLKKIILAGKNVYCEKPLCVTAAEAEEIARLAKEKGVVAQIVFNNRFMTGPLRAKELIEEGRLGRILSFRGTYLHASCADPERKAGWKQNRDICGGGVLFDLGSHILDMMYYLCGPYKSVYGKSQIAYPTRLGMNGEEWQTNADEAFYVCAEMANGAVGTVEASKIAVGSNDDFSFEVRGTKGSVKFDLMEPNFLWFYDGTAKDGNYGGDRGYTKIECVGRYPAPGGIFPSFKAPIGWLRGHMESYRQFLAACEGKTATTPDFDDAAHIQRVMECAYESDRIGCKVDI